MKLPIRRLAGVALSVTVCAIGFVYAGPSTPETSIIPTIDRSGDAMTDFSSWAVDPTSPGPDLPPLGRSLFDYLVTDSTGGINVYRVPFPFSALIDRIQARLGQQEYSGGTRLVMIPMGRSLQRTAAAPDFFKFPRIVLAVTGEPATSEHDAGALLKDRLYVGYVEKTGMLEVISYNETAGRFEFQLVKDYRPGAQPKVFYANRAICIACHQNHAPIFSNAIWGETNANGRVAQLLRSQRSDVQLSAQANIDFPDDIEKATVRANALVTLQNVWRQGCSDAHSRAQSQRCRAAAFAAVLQYGLSGEQDFDSASPSYQRDFVSTFGRVWRERWPQGLSVAQPSLPDRNPFGGATSPYGGAASEETSFNWIAAAHVSAKLDPLNPRPAREIWRFSGAMDASRFITGWAKSFADDDFRALDAFLHEPGGATAEGRRSALGAQCVAVQDSPGADAFKLQCTRDPAAAHGVDLVGRFVASGTGHIEWLNLGPAGQVRDLLFEGSPVRRVGSEYVLHAIPKKKKGLEPRLRDGRALESVEIRWPAGTPETNRSNPIEVRLKVILLDDFALVRQAVDRLLAQQPALFDEVPLARARLMRALFSELGMAERSWCCVDDTDMPSPAMDPPEVSASATQNPELQPFFRYCAACHLTHERFPPNFLSGTAAQVAESVRRCAPRILVRLSAWRTPADQLAKSPMPPALALQALGTTTQRWAGSEELERLRDYVERLSRKEGRPGDVGELLKDGYEALPPCLPAANQAGMRP